MDMFSEAFVQFESLLARKINEYPDEKLRARDLRQIIKSTADSVKAKHRWTPEKSAVRKLVKSLMSDAEGSYAGTEEFRRQDALLRHFGGLPEDAEEGYPFMVVRTGTRQTSIFTLGNGFDREYLGKMTLRPKRAVILTREGRKELDLENLPLPDTDESFPSNETVEETTSETLPPLETPTPTRAKLGLVGAEDSRIDYLGWTLTTERQPFTWGAKKCQVTGFLKNELPLREDDLLAADDSRDNPTKTLVMKTLAVKTYNKGAAVLTKKIEETINMIELEPIFEITSDYHGEVRPGNIDNYQLRLPTSRELRQAWRLSESGLPMGIVENHSEPTVYFYPKQPADLIYQSIFVTGVQGSGKTTFVRLMVRVLAGLQETPRHERPAIVILDGEGDYQKFNKLAELEAIARAFLENHHVSDIKPEILRVSTSQDADRTLSLQGIASADLIYLVPELPTKSTEVAAEVIRKCCDEHIETLLTVENLKSRVIDELIRNQQIARVQKSAIIRALEFSSNLRLFDVPGLLPLQGEELLVPGKVTVIDVSDLTEDQKRTVALYLLLCFDKSKITASSSDVGLMLVLDEAHRLFPRKAPSIHKEYIEKVASKINNIVHRGRKRRYGLLLATQSPADVYPLISDLCNTKIVFHTEGSSVWLGSNLGPELVKKVRKLSKGECIINVRGTGHSTPPLAIRVPNVTDIGITRAS